MKKTIRGLLLLLLSLSVLAGCGKAEDFSEKPAYLKSVTYVSDEWALNFWNSEDDHLEEELDQIVSDGFNSIILVVPWREFEPELDPVGFRTYPFEKLTRIMEVAEEKGLWVTLRVGYTWDYCDDGTDVRVRFRELLYDEKTQEAWDAYVIKLYETVSPYPNFYGGFLTWEDFWSFTYFAKSLGDTEEGRYWADISGYKEYVSQHYTLDELSKLYGEPIESLEEIYLPGAEQPALALLYEFFDEWLNEFLAHNQEIFPNMSMEVRMDSDQVCGVDGEWYWYDHSATYSCQNSDYVSLMYGVPIGHINQGERLTVEEALPTSRDMLDSVLLHTEGKKLYIEQFLYMDNTPGFEMNAQLQEDLTDDYILAMADVLKDRIMGYGVWTYINYGNNLLYNPQFALGDEGWELSGGAQVVEWNGSNQVLLPAGASLTNSIANEGTETYLRFTIDGEEEATVSVTFGEETQTVTGSGGSQVELTFTAGGTGLTFTADRPCYIDNVKVYTRVQEGQLYTMDGEEGTCIQAIRKLNKKLK